MIYRNELRRWDLLVNWWNLPNKKTGLFIGVRRNRAMTTARRSKNCVQNSQRIIPYIHWNHIEKEDQTYPAMQLSLTSKDMNTTTTPPSFPGFGMGVEGSLHGGGCI
jgi:hypothetical protein